MDIGRIITRITIILLSLFLLYHLVYRPVLYWQDSQLKKRAKKLHVGMTEQDVKAILGKPIEIMILSIEEAKRRFLFDEEVMEQFTNKNIEVQVHEYWIPMLLRGPSFLHLNPARTIIGICYDEQGRVFYVSIGEAVYEGIIIFGYEKKQNH